MTEHTQLADLVRSQRERLHLSYRSLADACRDAETETTVSTGWIHRLETGKPVVAPELAALRALATGLQLPLSRLQQAAGAQFFGLDHEQRYSIEALHLAEQLMRLTTEQRDAVTGLLDAFLPPSGA